MRIASEPVSCTNCGGTGSICEARGRRLQCLDDAKQIAAATPLHRIVAREAYLAAYHAAEAYLFERTGKAAKTHRGLRSEFGRLARNDPGIDREFLTFLAEG